MSNDLKKLIKECQNIAEKRGLRIEATQCQSEEEDSFVIHSKSAGRAVLLGSVDLCGQKLLVAYRIDIYKWNWAMNEGFSRDEIIKDL